jgi:hypothetical protein
MPTSARFLLLLTALLAAAWTHDANADKKTVCSITVNSSDEKEVFRRSLPPDKFQFVELVERVGWRRPAARESTATFLSFPATMTAATNSTRIDWKRVSSCPSPRWNESRATIRAPDCSRN